MDYCFIVNPQAGKKDMSVGLRPRIEQCFNERGLSYEILETHKAGHAVELARKAASRRGPVRICACGGDGTLNEVATGILGFDNAELGFFPGGSGNDFIKCFGSYEDFYDVGRFINGIARPIDIIEINGRYSVNIISVGVDADVAAGIPKFRRLPFCGGHAAYNLSLVQTLLRPIGKMLEVEVNGERRHKKFLLVAVGNGMVYGGGYYAMPEAMPDDGLMDVVLVDKIPRLRIAKLIGIYKKGDHIVEHEVIEELRSVMEYTTARELSISSEEEFAVNIDGEIEYMKQLSLRLLPKKLNFVVPEPKLK